MPVVVYLMNRLQHLDKQLMEKYCLKGVIAQQGFLRIHRKLNTCITFRQVKLMKSMPPNLGKFEVIFLRNVLVYSDQESKRQAVERPITILKSGGYFRRSFGKPACHHGKVAAYSTLDLP